MKKYVLTEVSGGRNSIPKAIDTIKNRLKEHKYSNKAIALVLLRAEDVLDVLIENANKCSMDDTVKVEFISFLGKSELRFSAAGDPVNIQEKALLPFMEMIDTDESNDNMHEFTMRLYEKLYGRSLRAKNRNRRNIVSIEIQQSSYSQLIVTVLALALGVGTGYLLHTFLGGDSADLISKYAFTPVYTAFMNTLKMIVAPLVFFSIASSIADFSDIESLGRIARRVVGLYLITSLLAIGVGLLSYKIMPIGNPELVKAISSEAAGATLEKGKGVTISIIDTFVGMVPTDIITPFQESNMLQIIFMAVVFGMSASVLVRKYPELRNGITMINAVFCKITEALVKFIPLVVFCSMAKMMIGMDLKALTQVIVWIPVIYIADMIMMGIYMLLLLIMERLDPITFLKKYYPAMFSAFVLSSSNAALPYSIRQCDEMGVSKKVYSFSLPLGATINMDGSCITLIISSLFFARIFGLPITSGMILSLVISIMVLSIGSPGVPGGALVCLAILIPQIGVPAEAISLVLGLYPIIGLMQTCANVTGDAVVCTIVAHREHALDMNKYNS